MGKLFFKLSGWLTLFVFTFVCGVYTANVGLTFLSQPSDVSVLFGTFLALGGFLSIFGVAGFCLARSLRTVREFLANTGGEEV